MTCLARLLGCLARGEAWGELWVDGCSEDEQLVEGHTWGEDQGGEWGDRWWAVGLEWDGDGRKFTEERCRRSDGILHYISGFGKKNG